MEKMSDRVIDGWGDFVADHIAKGWQPFLLSLMFKPLAGSERSKIGQMEQHLEAAYRIFVTRAVRKPKGKGARGRLPIMLCCPDLPVFKWDKRETMTLRDVAVNDGLHYQGILLMPPESRMEDVIGHFRSMRAVYAQQTRLERVDVKPIKNRPHRVTGYVLKQVDRGRFDAGDILIFPRSRSELAA